MTQMLLFDPPTASAPVSAPAAPVLPEPQKAPVRPIPAVKRAAASVSANDHKAGLNHMGDLARLVLLRYELAAKRRADMAAKRSKTRAK